LWTTIAAIHLCKRTIFWVFLVTLIGVKITKVRKTWSKARNIAEAASLMKKATRITAMRLEKV
jgi:hypothetical protein